LSRVPMSAVAACALALALPVATAAKRVPTEAERAALLHALGPLTARERSCMGWDISLSNDGRFASASLSFLLTRRCLRYAHNGDPVSELKGGGWGVVFDGSGPPPCSLHVPRDLGLGCID